MEVTAQIRPRTALAAVRAVLVWAGVAVLPLLWVLASAVATSGGGIGVMGWWLPERYLVPLLIVALPAALLRRRPLTGLGLMLVGAAFTSVTVHGGDQGYLRQLFTVQFLAVDAALGVVAANRSRRMSGLAVAVVLVTQILVAFVNSGVEPVDQALISVLAVATAWTLGNSVRSRREHAAALRAHAAAEAVTAERLRIARELHDVVAHSIGVIAIQAGVGARVIDTQPAQARAALSTIEATSRDTLAELRRTLGALRRGVGESAPLVPTPGLADLDRLVAATADAGVRVELRRHGTRPVPPEVDLAAFRIVQESLTNVVRHARVDACRVFVRCAPDQVAVEILDEGRGGPIGVEGHGLIGMRERVQALGGQFHAAPRPEGGFRVTARLPAPLPTDPNQPTDLDQPVDVDQAFGPDRPLDLDRLSDLDRPSDPDRPSDLDRPCGSEGQPGAVVGR